MSLYQKYRAKRFSEILTQDHITDTLMAAIKNKSIGHAYVFVGTRGTGKTSIARIFARAVNCSNEEHVQSHGEPCNECDSCLLSLRGAHIDIIEMDAASNRGIDEVRDLKEGVDFLPSQGRFKVYIIDEAHMMTKEAFNALLKTIEEPPQHVMFIMCTTEIFKLPPTILSRSQVFELRHAALEQIISKINYILEHENKSIETEGKEIIARLGKGSFRDTESILEKILNSNIDGEITSEHVIASLGLSSYILIDKFKEALYQKHLNELLGVLQNDIDEGMITNFNHQVAESIYNDISKSLTEEKINPFMFEIFDFLSSIDKEIRNSVNPKMIYIAKVLNFIKNYVPKNTEITPLNTNYEQNTGIEDSLSDDENNITDQDSETKEPPKDLSTNPSALLRFRKQSQQKPAVKEEVEDSGQESSKSKFISKLDFLEFVKSSNSFLFRFFSHHDFQINDGSLVIDATKQMEKDLLMKPQTVALIKSFGDKYGIQLKIVFGDVKIDKRTKEEKEVIQIQKKVEDLDDNEIHEIFNV